MLMVSQLVAQGASLPELLDTIARAATSVVSNASATAITLVDRATDGYRLGGSHGLSERYERTVASNPRRLGQSSATREAMRSRSVVWVEDAERDPRMAGWSADVRAEGYRSLLAVPLISTGQPIGTLINFRTLPGRWSESEIDLLRYFAEHACSAVQTAQLLAEREARLRGLERLVRTLREQAHEHTNRLHTVHGLLQLKDPQEASRFLSLILAEEREVQGTIAGQILHPVLSGFLAAEARIVGQRGIRLEVRRSQAPSLGGRLNDSSLITIVGNLLDNASDAVAGMEEDRRVIRFQLSEDDVAIRIQVSDMGRGLPSPVANVLAHGSTTKNGHSGVGLALVREAAAAAAGHVDLVSTDQGTTVTVILGTETHYG